jgi:hypothetical protein
MLLGDFFHETLDTLISISMVKITNKYLFLDYIPMYKMLSKNGEPLWLSSKEMKKSMKIKRSRVRSPARPRQPEKV